MGLLEGAGLRVARVEEPDDALVGLVDTVRTRLLTLQLAAELRSFSIPGVDWAQVRLMLRTAAAAVADGSLGYALITAAG